MTTQLPKERLTELAHNILACHDVSPGEIKTMASVLLAAYEQEPVAKVVSKFGDPEAFGERDLVVLVDIQKLPYNTPLYTHPASSIPAAVPVEDENEIKWRDLALQFDGHRMQAIGFLKQVLGYFAETGFPEARAFLKAAPLSGEEVLRARLAAMLQAEPAGWIPVRERLPAEGGRYWCYVEEQNSLGKSHYQWNCSWNGDVWSDDALTGRVTHWQPLAAPPKE